MIEVRIHGRGGQGAVVASKMLAEAVAREGNYVQSFPEFGVERRGAPVTAFTRIDDKPILVRSKIYEPDHLVVLEPTLLIAIDVFSGLKKGGWVIINSSKKPEEIEVPEGIKVATVDANNIAVANRLGTKESPIVNTAILGAFAKVTGIVGLEALLEAIKEEAPVKQEENMTAAKQAYEKVQF